MSFAFVFLSFCLSFFPHSTTPEQAVIARAHERNGLRVRARKDFWESKPKNFFWTLAPILEGKLHCKRNQITWKVFKIVITIVSLVLFGEQTYVSEKQTNISFYKFVLFLVLKHTAFKISNMVKQQTRMVWYFECGLNVNMAWKLLTLYLIFYCWEYK